MSATRGWWGGGLWSVVDQGIFSASNVLVSIAVARVLSESEFGAFGFAFSLLALAVTLHSTLVTEPMLALGSGRFGDRRSEYLSLLIVNQWRFVFGMAAAAVLVALVLALAGRKELAQSTFFMAIAVPGTLSLWALRRGCFLEVRPGTAVAASSQYLVILVAALLVVAAADRLSGGAAFVLMGLSAIPPSIWLFRRLEIRRPEPGLAGLRGEIHRSHARIGRWSLGSAVVKWVPRGGILLLLPWLSTLEEAARFAAMMNLVAPALQANVGLSTFLVPAYNRSRKEGRRTALLVRASVMMLFPAVVCCALLVLLGRPIVAWAYGGRYLDDLAPLIAISLLPVGTGTVTILGSVLFAEERMLAQFSTFAAGALATLVLGAWLAGSHGAFGAAIASVAGYGVVALGMTGCLIASGSRLPYEAGRARQ